MIRQEKNKSIYTLLFIVLSLITFKGFSQNKKIDSLKSLLPVKSDLQTCDIYYGLAYELIDIDYELGLEYSNEAFKAGMRSGDSLRMVKAGRIKSLAFRRLDKIDSALNLLSEIYGVAKRNNYVNELKTILNGLALAYTAKANYDKALKYLFESLELREKYGDKFDLSVVLNNIGLVYYKLKDYDTALTYYKQSVKIKREIGIRPGLELDAALVNISLCYGYKKSFAEARSFVEQGYYVCGSDCSEEFQVHAQFSLGITSFGEGNFSEAKERFLNSYALSKKREDERFQLDNIIYLLQIFVVKNQIQFAENYIGEAEALMSAGTPYNLELIKVYSEFLNLFKKSRDFKKLAYYQNKYITLKDSIYNEQLTTNLMKVEADHLEKENRARIESQNKILVLNKEVISRQKIINVTIGLITLLVTVLAIVLAKNNRQNKKINELLDNKVKERTRELEMNRDALQRAWQERDALINKASTDIKSSIATLKGLCFLGIKDIDHPKALQYLKKMDATSDELSDIINRMFYSYKIETPR